MADDQTFMLEDGSVLTIAVTRDGVTFTVPGTGPRVLVPEIAAELGCWLTQQLPPVVVAAGGERVRAARHAARWAPVRLRSHYDPARHHV